MIEHLPTIRYEKYICELYILEPEFGDNLLKKLGILMIDLLMETIHSFSSQLKSYDSHQDLSDNSMVYILNQLVEHLQNVTELDNSLITFLIVLKLVISYTIDQFHSFQKGYEWELYVHGDVRQRIQAQYRISLVLSFKIIFSTTVSTAVAKLEQVVNRCCEYGVLGRFG